jgi:hypothetical protein
MGTVYAAAQHMDSLAFRSAQGPLRVNFCRNSMSVLCLLSLQGKSSECSELRLDVFWEAALSVGKAAAIEVRLSSETLAVT